MEEQRLFCARHPEVETGLRCGKCDTPICGHCLVHTPVGARCRDCAQVRRLPTFEVSPVYYMRASLAGLGLVVALSVLYVLLAPILFTIPFLGLIAAAALGYVVGEGVSFAVNRKRGRGLQTIAAGVTLVVYGVGSIFSLNLFASLYGLLAVLAGVYIATTRVR